MKKKKASNKTTGRQFVFLSLGAFFSLAIFVFAVGKSYGEGAYISRENGVITFSDRKKNRSFKPYASEITSFSKKKRYSYKDFKSRIFRSSQKYGMEPEFIRAVIETESNFNPYARSKKGAIGLMQLMPGTAKELKVNPHSVSGNIDGGTHYLQLLKKKYRSDLKLTLAAYNAGWRNVEKYRGIPPFRETRNYVKKVMKRYKKYRGGRISTSQYTFLSPQKELKRTTKKVSYSKKYMKEIKPIDTKKDDKSQIAELINLYN